MNILELIDFMNDAVKKQESALVGFEKRYDSRADLLRIRIEGYKNAIADVRVFLDSELKDMGVFYNG